MKHLALFVSFCLIFSSFSVPVSQAASFSCAGGLFRVEQKNLKFDEAEIRAIEEIFTQRQNRFEIEMMRLFGLAREQNDRYKRFDYRFIPTLSMGFAVGVMSLIATFGEGISEPVAWLTGLAGVALAIGAMAGRSHREQGQRKITKSLDHLREAHDQYYQRLVEQKMGEAPSREFQKETSEFLKLLAEMTALGKETSQERKQYSVSMDHLSSKVRKQNKLFNKLSYHLTPASIVSYMVGFAFLVTVFREGPPEPVVWASGVAGLGLIIGAMVGRAYRESGQLEIIRALDGLREVHREYHINLFVRHERTLPAGVKEKIVEFSRTLETQMTNDESGSREDKILRNFTHWIDQSHEGREFSDVLFKTEIGRLWLTLYLNLMTKVTAYSDADPGNGGLSQTKQAEKNIERVDRFFKEDLIRISEKFRQGAEINRANEASVSR